MTVAKEKTRYTFSTFGKPLTYAFALLPMLMVPMALERHDLTAVGVGVLLVLFLWRNGVTIDTAAGTVSAWSGPFVPVFSTTYAASEYDIVSVMEDSVEVFNQRGQTIVSERRYSSSLALKLQARLTAETPFPEDLPPPLTLRKFGMSGHARAKQDGEAIATRLGLEFRSDI